MFMGVLNLCDLHIKLPKMGLGYLDAMHTLFSCGIYLSIINIRRILTYRRQPLKYHYSSQSKYSSNVPFPLIIEI